MYENIVRPEDKQYMNTGNQSNIKQMHSIHAVYKSYTILVQS